MNPTLEEKVGVVWREAGSLNPPDPLSKGGGARRVKNLGQKFESNICLPFSPAGTPLSKGGQGGFNQPRQALTPRQAKKIFSKTIAMFRKSCTFAASK